jgi:hypothetical protein
VRWIWFYCGGLLPECWSSTLKVEGERLFGKRGGQYFEILPADIVKVEEFGGSNPFVLATTADGRFHVGALTKRYDDVVRVLEQYAGSGFCDGFTHYCNVLLYRKQFRLLSLIKRLLFFGATPLKDAETLPKESPGQRRMIELLRRHSLLYAAQAIAFLISLPAFVSAVNFIDAETPQQAIARNGKPLPPGWTAGVMNHGEYYRWWTIQERPVLFGLSALSLVAAILFLWSSLAWLWWKAENKELGEKRGEKRTPGHGTK